MTRAFSETLARLNREAAGLLRVEIIRPSDHAALAYFALAGDKAAWSRLNAIFESREFIQSAGNEKVVCLTCANLVTDPNAALALLVAAQDDATVALCSALCGRCSTGDADEILRRATAGYQAAWPGLRCVEITHPEGGRA